MPASKHLKDLPSHGEKPHRQVWTGNSCWPRISASVMSDLSVSALFRLTGMSSHMGSFLQVGGISGRAMTRS